MPKDKGSQRVTQKRDQKKSTCQARYEKAAPRDSTACVASSIGMVILHPVLTPTTGNPISAATTAI